MTSFSSFRKQSEREFEEKFIMEGSDCTWKVYPTPEEVKSFLSQKLEEAYRMGVEEGREK